ncbi:MAG: hypothetical protein ABI616_00435 [Pseudomonadota bacterium]
MMVTTRLKILLAMAGAVAIFIVVTWPDAQPAKVAEVAPRPAKPKQVSKVAVAQNPAVRSRRVADSADAPSLFHTISWYVAPPPPPPPPPAPPVKPPPPTAPPLPFSFMGSYSHPGDRATYFLMRGDRVIDVHVGDKIDGTYSVDSDENGQLLLTFLPLKIQQGLALTGSP